MCWHICVLVFCTGGSRYIWMIFFFVYGFSIVWVVGVNGPIFSGTHCHRLTRCRVALKLCIESVLCVCTSHCTVLRVEIVPPKHRTYIFRYFLLTRNPPSAGLNYWCTEKTTLIREDKTRSGLQQPWNLTWVWVCVTLKTASTRLLSSVSLPLVRSSLESHTHTQAGSQAAS